MAVKKYLDETGLTEVAAHVNTRLKTVTTMPVTADEGAIRMYCGETTSNFIKGHTYQMRPTLEQRLQFSADTTTYFMTQDGTITDVAPTSYSPQIEGIPVVDPDTGAELVYMAGNNALVQRLGSDVNTITVDFNKIKSSVMPWWTAGAATGSYNPYTIRNVKLVSITEWVDITPSGSILSVGSVNDLLTAWTSMDDDSTAVVNVTTTFALNADYNIPTGRHFLLKGSNADKTTLWTNDGRIFSATLETSVLVWTELHDESVLSKVNELPSNPSVGDTVLYNGTTGTEIDGHIYKYKDLTQNFIGAEVDGTFYDMNGNTISTPTSPEYSTSITISEGGYVLCVDSVAGKLFAKKTENDTTYSVTMNDDGTFTVGDAYVPESSAEVTAGNIATWSIEEFGWVDLTPNTTFNPDDFDVSDGNEVSLVGSVKKIFEGTEDEFLALPVAERKKYDEIHSPDGLDESQITDSITAGDMKAVTSNAVAQVVPSNASASNKLITEEYGNKNFIRYGFYQAPGGDSYRRLMIHNSSYLNGKFCCVDRSGNEYMITIKSGAPTSFCKVNNVNSNTERIVDIRFYTEDVTKIHLYIQSNDWNCLNYYFISDSESEIDEFDSNSTEYNDANAITWQNNFKYQVLETDSDLNNVKTSGVYSIYISDAASQATNHAPNYGWLQLIVIQMNNSQVFCNQILYRSSGEMYMRECGNDSWTAWEQFAVKSELPNAGVGSGINKQDIVSGEANTTINIPAYHFCSGFMWLQISGIGTALLSYDVDYVRNLTLKVIAGTGILLTGLTLNKGETLLGTFSANGDYITFTPQYYTTIRTNYASL